MRNASRRGSTVIASCVMLATAVVALMSASIAAAQSARVEELVSAVVRINTHINPEGRTVQGLGREREGSGHPWDRLPRASVALQVSHAPSAFL